MGRRRVGYLPINAATAAAGGGGGGAPSGPAGGDLGGTYPNPTVVDLTITGETRGDLLTRGAGAWVRLAPGTSGYALLSAGAGSDLTWGSVYTPGGTDVAVADGGTGASSASGARTNLGLAIGSDVQAYDADLDAYAALATTGLVVRTGSGTATTRTLTGTAGRIGVTNGDGVSGAPTLDLATSGVSAGSYGSGTAIPVVTVDVYGRVTSVTTTAVTSTGAVYAPTYGASAAPSGYQWAMSGRRLELAPATTSFPSLNLLTAVLPGRHRRNSSTWVAATCSGGTVTPQIATSSGDYNSAGHGAATLLGGVLVAAGRGWTLTTHLSGSLTSTNTNGLGIGCWDGVNNSKSCRIAVYYSGGVLKVYAEYSTTGSSTTITAGDLTTGVWLQIEAAPDGTLYLRYKLAASASTPPMSGWTTPLTVTDFFWNYSGLGVWQTVHYSLHGLNSTGANRTLCAVNGYWDTSLGGEGLIRTPGDGAGVGVSSASPTGTLFTDVPYDSSVCDQTALRVWAAKVACPANSLETATVEFLVRSTNTPGSYSGSTWYAASAIVAPSSAAYLEVQWRITSDGITLGSVDVGAASALRVK